MKRCTALRTSFLSCKGSGFGCQPRRWASYDKADLTKEALRRQVEAGLGEDAHGKPLTIDPDAKTVDTASGALPISPLFDPAWLKARRRQKKGEKGTVALGRFHKKLANNPYARALSTPLRRCPVTDTQLPRQFLQDFELVKHPTDGEGDWWVPGPLSFDFIEPTNTHPEGEAIGEDSAVQAEGLKGVDTSTTSAPSQDTTSAKRPRRAPATAYALCRKTIIDDLDANAQKTSAMILGARHGMGITQDMRKGVWVATSDKLLQLYRRTAVDTLIARANQHELPEHKFVQPCASWDAVKDVEMRGCVLWLPKDKENAATQYATLDVQDTVYGGKMAVHNLHWLLGEDEVDRLRAAAEVFRENEIVVLRQRKNFKVMRLHMLLWRLQGFLAQLEQ